MGNKADQNDPRNKNSLFDTVECFRMNHSAADTRPQGDVGVPIVNAGDKMHRYAGVKMHQ